VPLLLPPDAPRIEWLAHRNGGVRYKSFQLCRHVLSISSLAAGNTASFADTGASAS